MAVGLAEAAAANATEAEGPKLRKVQKHLNSEDKLYSEVPRGLPQLQWDGRGQTCGLRAECLSGRCLSEIDPSAHVSDLPDMWLPRACRVDRRSATCTS